MQNTEIIIYIHNLQLNSERRRKKRRAHVTEIFHKRVCEKKDMRHNKTKECLAAMVCGTHFVRSRRQVGVRHKIGFLLSVRSLIRKDKRKKTAIRKKNRRCVTKKNV